MNKEEKAQRMIGALSMMHWLYNTSKLERVLRSRGAEALGEPAHPNYMAEKTKGSDAMWFSTLDAGRTSRVLNDAIQGRYKEAAEDQVFGDYAMPLDVDIMTDDEVKVAWQEYADYAKKIPK
jgi:hypothetical protein